MTISRTAVMAFALGLAPSAYLLGVHEARAAEGVPQTVTAREFVLVDATGKKRASFYVHPDGTAGIGIGDSAGRVLALMAVSSSGEPEFALLNGSGQTRSRWFVDKQQVGLLLSDSRSAPRLGLSAGETDARLTMMDSSTNSARIAISAENKGNSSFALLDGSGEPRAILSVGSKGKVTRLP